jgi:flagellar biosynthesis protein FliP
MVDCRGTYASDVIAGAAVVYDSPVRLLVVFHFLRQALGTQTAPSNQVLMGLALMMTWFLMQPVLLQVEQQAVTPYQAGTISGMDAMDRGLQPVKQYMLRYARDKDLAVFAAAGMSTRPATKQDLPIQVVVPAYLFERVEGWISDWSCFVSSVPAG